MMNIERIEYLFERHESHTATQAETEELFRWVEDPANQEQIIGYFTRGIQIQPEAVVNPQIWDPVIRSILQNLPQEEPLGAGRKVLKLSAFRWAAAAVLILALGVGVWFYWGREGQQEIVQKEGIDQRFKNDIPPGGDKAILTLADGRQIILDSVSGNVAKEGGVTVINLAGQLSYELSVNGQRSTVNYHTVATPRGGQYQLVLADGSKVWLNAASALRFPTAFPGKERVVELTGEGYFEVAHNKAKPFRVSVNGMEEEVLGTHFNINSYEDEDAIRTTLLEGSVKVTAANSRLTIDDSRILKPGEQAAFTIDDSRLTIHNDVDLDAVMAWKNGLFLFESADLPSIMRQLERWYDIVVIYEGKVPQRRFVGSVSKNIPLSGVLRILEANNIHFKMNGKKLIIQP